MPTPNENLATSLTRLRKLQRDGRRVFQATDLSRVHRDRLLKNGFVLEVMKGWLISSSPATRDGESTPWYASFWEFCARYCNERFAGDWCLSPEQSLLLHAENTIVPTQVVVQSPAATNHNLTLLFGTALYDLKQPNMPPQSETMVRNGLRLFTPEAALMKVPESFFTRHPIESRIVVASVHGATELLRGLLDGGHSVVAGRLAGAFRRIGRSAVSDEIITTMKAAGYDVREHDPFTEASAPSTIPAGTPPIVGRMWAAWESMRAKVLDIFPPPPRRSPDPASYMQSVQEIYRNDAYHSLSIEGYSVSFELIERVRAGNWDPTNHEADRQSRDALAARGYWQAFESVKATIAPILTGQNAGDLVRNAHRDWYRELFQPCVGAGLIAPSALAGYRNEAVYLRTSRYVPPRWEAVRDAMPALFDLLQNEPEPAVRAVLGHWLFGYIHPYPDGNGRIARFLMNAMLASGGYPWTIIRIDDRDAYLSALDTASLGMDIVPFARLMAERTSDALKTQRPKARARTRR